MYAPLPLRLVIEVSNLGPQLRARVLRMQLFQLVPQLLGLHVCNLRDDDADLDNLVSDHFGAGRRRHALLPHAQLLPALGAGRNAEHGAAVDGRHLHLGAQGGLPWQDGQRDADVIGLAVEHRVLGDAYDHVEIAGRRATRPGIALARQSDALSVARSGLDAERDRLLRHAPRRRGPLNVQLHLAAPDRLPERHLHGVFNVRAGRARRFLRCARPAEDVGEDVAEAAPSAVRLPAAEVEVAEVELHALAAARAEAAVAGERIASRGAAAALGIGLGRLWIDVA